MDWLKIVQKRNIQIVNDEKGEGIKQKLYGRNNNGYGRGKDEMVVKTN